MVLASVSLALRKLCFDPIIAAERTNERGKRSGIDRYKREMSHASPEDLGRVPRWVCQFIAGFIDGDGSIGAYIGHNGDVRVQVSAEQAILGADVLLLLYHFFKGLVFLSFFLSFFFFFVGGRGCGSKTHTFSSFFPPSFSRTFSLSLSPLLFYKTKQSDILRRAAVAEAPAHVSMGDHGRVGGRVFEENPRISPPKKRSSLGGSGPRAPQRPREHG